MNLFELRINSSELFEATLIDDSVRFIEEKPVNVWVEGESLYLAQGGTVTTLENIQSADKTAVHARLYIQQHNLLWSLVKQETDALWLMATPLKDEIVRVDGENFNLGISEYIVEQLKNQKHIGDNDVNLAIVWLEENFLITENVSFVETSHSYTTALFITFLNQNSTDDTLSLVGKAHILDIKVSNNQWNIQRIRPFNPHSDNIELSAIQGNIVFFDNSQAQKLNQPHYKTALKDSKNTHGNYIKVWQKYSDLQWQKVVINAQKFNYLKILDDKILEQQNLSRLSVNKEQLKKFAEALQASIQSNDKENHVFQIASTLPEWLSNSSPGNSSKADHKKALEEPWKCEIVDIDSDSGYLTIKYTGFREKKKPVDKHGNSFLFLSIYSTQVQRQRQVLALEQISHHHNPMPSLDYLMQGIAVPTIKKSRKLRWHSPQVKALFKAGPTTRRQQQAIETALNSADITVIIGPPGTGKTQVIAAIQQRIVEEKAKDNTPVQRSILLTSYQHDAVDNANSRTQVLGLPGLRVGSKYQDNIGQKDVNLPIQKWRNSTQDVLTQEIDDCYALTLLDSLKHATLNLRLGARDIKERSKIEINRILTDFNTYYHIVPSHDWRLWWEGFTLEQSYFSPSLLQNCIPNIWALRTSASSFADDGIQRCAELSAFLTLLQNDNPDTQLISEDKLQILDNFGHMQIPPPSDADLIPLQQLKDTLLDKSLPDFRPLNIQSILTASDCDRLDELDTQMTKKISDSHTLGYLLALKQFRETVATDDNKVDETIAHYTSVYAATCQKSASQDMRRLTQLSQDSNINFENVIVDEAARATPLDLMIPMAMANRRIVLVGDHRQLPHMLDDAVETQMVEEDDWDSLQSEMLRDSLFQRMVKNLTQLEKEDGQPKRVVMLDEQFRMHPVLGDFISKNFYENHGLSKLKSGRPTTDFIHDISGYEGMVCHWQHIEGTQKGNKRRNMNEAIWISQETKRILDENPEISVGVITFYGDQRSALMQEMQKLDLILNNEVHPDYQQLTKGSHIGDERLRVGTVDSFQGKEFDVVLLSLVRTLPNDLKTVTKNRGYEMTEPQLNSLYGFLRVDNRLNVAFSRQRSLIIIAGDLMLAEHPLTEQHIPSLTAMSQLCRGDYGQIF